MKDLLIVEKDFGTINQIWTVKKQGIFFLNKFNHPKTVNSCCKVCFCSATSKLKRGGFLKRVVGRFTTEPQNSWLKTPRKSGGQQKSSQL